MKHRLLFIQMTAMISDLPAVISTNTRRGCQAVTPGCCNDLFLPRDWLTRKGGGTKTVRGPASYLEAHGVDAKASGKTRTRLSAWKANCEAHHSGVFLNPNQHSSWSVTCGGIRPALRKTRPLLSSDIPQSTVSRRRKGLRLSTHCPPGLLVSTRGACWPMTGDPTCMQLTSRRSSSPTAQGMECPRNLTAFPIPVAQLLTLR